MKLIFMYTSHGNAPYGKGPAWDPAKETMNQFAVEPGGLPSEGYLFLLKRLKEERVFDEITVIIESNRWPGTCSYPTKLGGIRCCVLPDISQAAQLIDKGDIIWARGGFRSWHNFLENYKGRNWLVLYGADAGRERWLFWDVVLDDLGNEAHLDRRGRFWLPFKKPINEQVFMPLDLSPKYDVCIGASHIHDKKAQWKVVDAAIAYRKMTGRDLKCVLPGKNKNGAKTNQMWAKLKKHNLDVDQIGMVPRPRMCEIYNRSRLFVYLGRGGQNDRGPLEALCCGTPVLLADYKRHAYFMRSAFGAVRLLSDSPPDETARQIEKHLTRVTSERRPEVASFFKRNSGMEKVILPEMKLFFEILKNNKPGKEVLVSEYL